MKKYYNLGFKYFFTMRRLMLAIVFISITIYSCDKIDNPLISNSGNVKVPTSGLTRVDSTSTTSDNLLKVLVEDYTAHHCQNCPTTAAQCEALLAAQPTQTVFMELNVADLAQSYTPTYWSLPTQDSAYYNDYTTTAGNNWNNTFINGNNSLPGTMVNRLYYNGNPGGAQDLFTNGGPDANVATPADSLITANNKLAKIHIVDSLYAPPVSTVSMSITTTLVSHVSGVKYYLVVGLVEDSIFDWQDSVNHDKQYYLKRMTFRASINDGGTGAGVLLDSTSAPQTVHYAYANTVHFTYNSAIAKPPYPSEPGKYWNMAHMYVVAFVYQVSSTGHNYMVLQAQNLHL